MDDCDTSTVQPGVFLAFVISDDPLGSSSYSQRPIARQLACNCHGQVRGWHKFQNRCLHSKVDNTGERISQWVQSVERVDHSLWNSGVSVEVSDVGDSHTKLQLGGSHGCWRRFFVGGVGIGFAREGEG
jgi:hypothetical protein